MRAPLIALAALAACMETPVYEGRACDPAGACPDELVCVAGVCRASAAVGGDAGPRDAVATASPDALPLVEEDGGDGRPDRDAAAPDAAPDAGPRDALPLPDAGPSCALTAPTVGWSIAYFARDPAGEPDLTRCFGAETAPADELAGLWVPPPDVVRAARASSWVMVARARRTFRGTELFHLEHEGGARLTANGTAVIDAWTEQGATHDVGTYATGAQTLELTVGDRGGGGGFTLTRDNLCDAVDAQPAAAGEWLATYYRVRTSAMGGWALDRDDCLGGELFAEAWLDLGGAWMSGGPPPVVALGVTDLWGGVFRTARAQAQSVDVRVTHDDGLRVSVDGVAIYESWAAPQVVNTTVRLPQGNYLLTLDYFENLGGAGLRFQSP